MSNGRTSRVFFKTAWNWDINVVVSKSVINVRQLSSDENESQSRPRGHRASCLPLSVDMTYLEWRAWCDAILCRLSCWNGKCRVQHREHLSLSSVLVARPRSHDPMTSFRDHLWAMSMSEWAWPETRKTYRRCRLLAGWGGWVKHLSAPVALRQQRSSINIAWTLCHVMRNHSFQY